MPQQFDLSVIIVSYNVAHLIGDCLDSLFRDCAGIEIEVFVVDSASTDNSVAFIRKNYPQVNLITSPDNIGFAASNNIALRQCRGNYVLLLNPDTLVHQGTIPELLSYLDAHPKVGAVGPTIRLGDGRIQPECARNLPKLSNMLPYLLLLDKLEWKLRFKEGYRATNLHPPRGTLLDSFYLLSWGRDRTCEVESIVGAFILVRHEVVAKIGELDESSPFYLDDIDYCRRIRNAGWSIHYVAGPTITHLWQQSSGQLKRKADFYSMLCHSTWLYFYKHEGRLAAAMFSLMVCAAAVIRVPLSAIALLLANDKNRDFCQYQLHMSLGLARWGFRVPKTAPDLGFSNTAATASKVEATVVGQSQ